MSDFLSEVDRHTLNKIARAIPGMISDPAERENVQILYDLLRQHMERVAALESVLRALVDSAVNLTIAWESIWNDAAGIVEAGIREQMQFNALMDELDDKKADAWLKLTEDRQ